MKLPSGWTLAELKDPKYHSVVSQFWLGRAQECEDLLKQMHTHLSENLQNNIWSGSKFHQEIVRVLNNEQPKVVKNFLVYPNPETTDDRWYLEILYENGRIDKHEISWVTAEVLKKVMK